MKVLVVDDTVLMRQYFKKIIESAFQDIEVIVASDGIIALEKIKFYNPDVITLDFEMPGMNGLECLQEIIKISKTPVIMVSAYTTQGAKVTLDALSLGAFDFICKPSKVESGKTEEFESLFIEKVEAALHFSKKNQSIRKVSHTAEFIKNTQAVTEATAKILSEHVKYDYSKVEIIGIGISTGGPSVVREILSSLPKNFKLPILIVQHMPVGFTSEFAERLNSICKIEVKEAEEGDVIKPGRALVAPGGKHLKVDRGMSGLFIRVFDGEKVSGHKPSADVLFSSLAKEYGEKALGIIMTGMGADGSKGLLELKKSGANTWAQNEETCVVYGMPKAAVEIGAVCEVLSVEAIIARLKQIGS